MTIPSIASVSYSGASQVLGRTKPYFAFSNNGFKFTQYSWPPR